MKAELHLEDGTVVSGEQIGAPVSAAGEVVFNTGMVGYPETMTDPSYAGQILVFTYPLIGNYGVQNIQGVSDPAEIPDWCESNTIHVRAIVVSRLSESYSHWSARASLDAWMKSHGVPGIAGVDTRTITKRLRERGTMLGKLVVGDRDIPWQDPNARNIVADVSTSAPRIHPAGETTCVLVDFGVKQSIIRSLTRRGITVMQVPWNYDWTGEDVQGVILSNGPGDPKKCAEAIDIIRKGFENDLPLFGICLGHQLLALAGGGDTYKMRYGHRSQNQPCIQVGSKRCHITSQNHGFAVDERTVEGEWEPWFFNANDGTNEGIKHRTRPIYSVQFHPEAHPGPTDTDGFFDVFTRYMSHAKSPA